MGGGLEDTIQYVFYEWTARSLGGRTVPAECTLQTRQQHVSTAREHEGEKEGGLDREGEKVRLRFCSIWHSCFLSGGLCCLFIPLGVAQLPL
ncbi:hypothetical protein AAFF_G00319630 [Aldrovandia affinis]|uniref:Uncharacterized protein n=1 Tax=Aldrovandia affinis TaxID=143900 RepID=A0AAD7SN43_9TELE|nr:hypothetical protein AAFF_G00319630 [Aldrovandia affinis]